MLGDNAFVYGTEDERTEQAVQVRFKNFATVSECTR